MDSFTRGYIEAALWSSDDDEGRSLDRNYSSSDITAATLRKMESDARKFQRMTGARGAEDGHNFWLSRNGHGAGFQDEGTAEGDALHRAAKSFGEFNLMVTPRGKIGAYEVPSRRRKNPSRSRRRAPARRRRPASRRRR